MMRELTLVLRKHAAPFLLSSSNLPHKTICGTLFFVLTGHASCWLRLSCRH